MVTSLSSNKRTFATLAAILFIVGIGVGYALGIFTRGPSVATTATVTITTTALSPSVSEKTYKFKMFMVFGKGDPYFDDIKYFVSLVSNLTNGKVIIEPYSYAELGIKLSEQLEALKAKTVEFALVSPAFLPEDPVFPLMSSKPGPISDAYELYYYINEESDIINATFAKYGVVYIGPTYFRPETVAFRVPVHSVDEMKGKIIRSAGLAATFYQLLGLQAVVLPGGELYTALQTGTVDGLEWTDWSSHYVNGFYEVAKYVIEPTRGINIHSEAYPMYLCANPEVWKSLPEDYRKAIRVAIYLTFFYASYRQDKAYYFYKQKCIEAGNTAIKLPESDYPKIIEAGVQLHVLMAKKSDVCKEYVKRLINIWRDLGYDNWAKALEEAMKKEGLI